MPIKVYLLLFVCFLAAGLGALWLIQGYDLGARYRFGVILGTGLCLWALTKRAWVAMPYEDDQHLDDDRSG